jgi:putative ATP-dependent endonuclease of OLD family
VHFLKGFSADKAVLEALAEKLDIPLDTKGISVLDMSGKEGLRIPYAMFVELGIAAYVVADGDSLGAARKHPSDATKQAAAHASHKQATDKIVTWLPTSTALHGTLPYAFGSPTIVTGGYTVWEDDIEEELSKWPSFIAALATNGSTPRSKDLLAYRTAVLDADVADLPAGLKACVEAIASFE